MIRAVLDANVLVSAILSHKGIPAKILSAWRDEKFLVLVSAAILDEIGRVLRYPKIKKPIAGLKRGFKDFWKTSPGLRSLPQAISPSRSLLLIPQTIVTSNVPWRERPTTSATSITTFLT